MLSKDNKLIKASLKLKQKKYRELEGKFLIEGIRFIEEAIKENKVDMIFYSQKLLKVNDYERIFVDNVDTYEVAEEIITQLSDTENPQGAVAIAYKDQFSFEDIKNNFIIIVDGVQDPGNLGTIIRTADACAVGGICIVKGTVDVYNNKTLRATMGSIFHTPILFFEDFEALINELKDKNYRIYASSLATDKNLFDYDFKENTAVIIGNEANGIPSPHMEQATDLMKIPMPGKAESLNAGVAAAVIMYEIVRQRL